MNSQFWWFAGLAAVVLIVQGLMLWALLRSLWEARSAISRLQHSLADLSASNASVESAYNRLLLHNERTRGLR